MKPTRKLTQNQKFFFEHAGWSYHPLTESRALGRTRCAVSLAAAEQAFMRAGVSCVWEDDQPERGTKCKTCEWCSIRSADGAILAALGMITDADANYRRVIRAELALECLEQLEGLTS